MAGTQERSTQVCGGRVVCSVVVCAGVCGTGDRTIVGERGRNGRW